jgi:hypothetical protein
MNLNYKTCYLCNSKQNLAHFTCSHSFCIDCFHRVLIYNKDNFISQINTDTMTLICQKCDEGNISTSLAELHKALLPAPIINTEVEICHPHLEPYSLQCTSCSMKLCIYCFKAHSGMFPFHRVVQLASDSTNVCNTHFKEQKLNELRCETCDLSICQHCTAESHQGHKLISLVTYKQNSLSRMTREVGMSLPNAESYYNDDLFYGVILQIKNSHKVLTDKIKSLRATLDNFESRVNQKMTLQLDKIEKNKTLLIQCYKKYNSDLSKQKAKVYLDFSELSYEKDILSIKECFAEEINTVLDPIAKKLQEEITKYTSDMFDIRHPFISKHKKTLTRPYKNINFVPGSLNNKFIFYYEKERNQVGGYIYDLEKRKTTNILNIFSPGVQSVKNIFLLNNLLFVICNENLVKIFDAAMNYNFKFDLKQDVHRSIEKILMPDDSTAILLYDNDYVVIWNIKTMTYKFFEYRYYKVKNLIKVSESELIGLFKRYSLFSNSSVMDYISIINEESK